MKMLIVIGQVGTVIAALLAAWFWFQSAQGEAPPATWDQIGQLKPWLDHAARLNRLAAMWTGISAVLLAVTTAGGWF
jgi:hypothetical protein